MIAIEEYKNEFHDEYFSNSGEKKLIEKCLGESSLSEEFVAWYRSIKQRANNKFKKFLKDDKV